jgi:hypothetical protein
VNDHFSLLHLADTELIPQWWHQLWAFPSWGEPMLISFGCGVGLQLAEFRRLAGYTMARFFSPKQLLILL